MMSTGFSCLSHHKVEPYTDPKVSFTGQYTGSWGKSFAKGSPLEWYNPPVDSLENEHYIMYQDPLELIPDADLM